jgi:pimeloyl-ACP methyl ester carboxylesterase
MSFIRSKTATIYYEECGSGETLILLPGLLGTIESHWRRYIPSFAEHFHVVAVDLRGHGKTNNPSGQFRLHELINDLFTLYESLDIDRARICGYSLGGYLGLAFGVQNPGTVDSLLMHGTRFFWNNGVVRETIKDFDAERIVEKVPQWAEQLQRDHAPANGLTGWRTLLRAATEFIKTMPSEGLTTSALQLADFPVLVSSGDQDELVPREEVERLANCLPYGMPHIFPNTPHPMQKVDKQAFLDIAYSFFHVTNREGVQVLSRILPG